MREFNTISFYNCKFRFKIRWYSPLIFITFPEVLFILDCDFCQCNAHKTYISDHIIESLDLHQGLNILSNYTFNLNKNIISEVIKT